MSDKIKISICLGSSCFSRGNKKSTEIIQEYIKRNNLSSEINFQGCLCTSNCSQGPVININDKSYYQVEPITVIDILDHVIREDTK